MMYRHVTLALATLLVLAAPCGALGTKLAALPVQGDHESPTNVALPTSPFAPPPKTDETFVASEGPGLDTHCQFRGEGPLRIQVPIDRYVGTTNEQGFLLDPAGLVAGQIIAPTVRISMPAWDVDSRVQGVVPEIDLIYINGNPTHRRLLGLTDTWVMNEIEIPVEYLRFPTPGDGEGSEPSTPPAPMMNEIVIHIDVGNTQVENWCTAIDWVSIDIRAMAPIVLVHGISADHSTWDEVIPYLNELKVPYAWSDQEPNGSVLGNASLLLLHVERIRVRFGVRKLHIVAHSKGGLDTRRFLALFAHAANFKILSLTTLGTPHHGSVGAAVGIAHEENKKLYSTDPDIRTVISISEAAFGTVPRSFFPRPPGLYDLHPDTAEAAIRDYAFPGNVKLFTFSGDADRNNDGRIEYVEYAGFFGAETYVDYTLVATTLYSLLSKVASVKVTRGACQGRYGCPTLVDPTYREMPVENDLAVAETSSRLPYETGHWGPYERNHSTLKSPGVMQVVLNNLRTSFPLMAP